MLTRNTTVLDFFKTRRSRPAKTLSLPVPTESEIKDILEMASRSPDHGALVPWRFIVIEGRDVMDRLATLAQERGEALGMDSERIAKGRGQFDKGNLAVVVVEVRKPSPKFPAIEQTYAVGGVCLALVNAALASGWGANWLTSWASHDREFCARGLNLAESETIAGIIHIGTETTTPPERSRPDVESITSWMNK